MVFFKSILTRSFLHHSLQVSRHRHVEAAPTTPENYWEVKMASREEQLRRGQILETTSPVGLRPKNPIYASKSFCRRLFEK